MQIASFIDGPARQTTRLPSLFASPPFPRTLRREEIEKNIFALADLILVWDCSARFLGDLNVASSSRKLSEEILIANRNQNLIKPRREVVLSMRNSIELDGLDVHHEHSVVELVSALYIFPVKCALHRRGCTNTEGNFFVTAHGQQLKISQPGGTAEGQKASQLMATAWTLLISQLIKTTDATTSTVSRRLSAFSALHFPINYQKTLRRSFASKQLSRPFFLVILFACPLRPLPHSSLKKLNKP